MIIVTGAAGFIGSQIALSLKDHAPKDLILVDKLKAFQTTAYTKGLVAPDKFMEASHAFLGLLPEIKDVKWIIHMGAITNTAEKDLNELKKWNVEYTKTLWNYCTQNKVNFIYASSAATYGSGEEGFSDDHN